jgi:hypothetical protein
VIEEIEEVSILVGNGSMLDKNTKGQHSEKLNCLQYLDEALFKDG